ncbi:hypothetical protein [Neobacillus kokaensis]|uniref:Rhodanese domain-containing protein n=1 Tax=Neobacillus kokaensis TaxID=2759023 RepID=A0ABQ3MZ09_9BACI|nr:hypothetical protein [Neobacillus kokaensis]GHH96637.1 hypothetical protein AM1BK_01800 [Neobacillus kokaensis]
MKFLLLITIIVSFILYRRYFPVFGVDLINLKDPEPKKIYVIDIRDYNESYKEPIKGAINIPIAYLKRNINQIPKGDLYIVASGSLEKNFGIRLLRQKGFRIVGYTISDNNKISLKENSLKIENNYC